ncbi:tRNA preQ1(34) S-adenosylmethionine ribosyltransferase-isomerase QueA [Verminephrobacter eiseniae]|uniref:tRNA preQ1(34) S-adenosylmethionine ribosyltransferase-isomerase QueA n=1 Tax=Verminephrobacter eiseniae TaxID=364317 RepID=UPI0010E4B187|nr:tRNA preQ1(34) S-adenosylmethionine ribosyltransferase-isomerase QueA [Verminephrobacter eiseniae]KAB7575632.1 tRNA preQ1(34) S-adenosylmethionine ribosyltransferase-isomerase QueA [Verminephrobacter sp. Larva24]MCW5232539.1 tRNA preQ1(34) S-adenosylmethionine ribosyltransferase-isomerase QueA [Verminephrobacter eiseniae]MCW5295895.1 tRNA preQ1(34) S-adenosylmethionine ribosyltransferase-isomerase QueA [Verminephrobacter eiseniae]MCW8185600.1 tRNA preQ1(34) S-adenosylmethionine ribosyltransf
MTDLPRSGAARAHTLSDFDFTLPPELIAQHPAPERSAARLLDGRTAPPVDRIFRELPGLLRAGDLLVSNDTRVLNARLFGAKASGGKLELLIERVLPAAAGSAGNEVAAHMKVGKKPQPGSTVQIAGGRQAGGFDATLLGRWPMADGPLYRFALHGPANESPWELMQRHGHLPLPPYIVRRQNTGHDPHEAEDSQRYQTLFARHPGAVAAPTAALHFDPSVLSALAARGIEHASITLHVGAGTFLPVKTENLEQHRMHSEWYRLPPSTLTALERCRQRGARVVAVGTTTVRTLESWARSGLATGETSIFITPGFPFQVVDLLITNFHLPKSTLMMLVSAFAGHAHVMALYRHAMAQRYRFFSYGDAMLLARQHDGPSHLALDAI